MLGTIHRQLSVSILLLAVSGLIGCSSGSPQPPNYGSEDGKAVSLLIEELNEKKADPKQSERLFASPPKNLKGYDKYSYDLTGKPAVTGTTATATLKILTDGGTDKGTQEWTFTKVGDQWKIQNAPLP